MPGSGGKWGELLKEAVPQVSRVAVLWDPTAGSQLLPVVGETERAARSLGLQLQLLEARGANAFDSAYAAMAREGVEALIAPPTTSIAS